MAAFDKEKSEELSRLYAGHDSSPKGSIDLPCLDLVNFINEELVDYVTTSSCSGRISVYRDKTDECKGVHWLLVKHGYLAKDLFLSCLTAAAAGREEGQVASSMTLKCEGMILHCKCRDVAAAARLHQVSIAAGYREGGITVGKHHVMLAIRTTAYTLESPLIAAGMHLPLPFLEMLLDQANRRMIQNTLRLGKFLRMLKEFFGFPVLFPISPGPGSGIKRIGLAAAHLAGQVLCFGGQGSSGRSQTATLYGEDIRSHCQIDGQATAPVHGVMLKLPCKVFGHIVIISGGRCSPKDSLPCLALYRYIESDLTGKSELEPVTFDETGVAPARRWGHSLIHLEHYSNGREKGLGDVDSEEAVYMLHGGRDLHQVYSDSHLLTVRVGTNGSITAAWHRLQLRNGEGIGALVPSSVLLSDDDDGDFVAEMDADGEEPQPRFFHACALLPNAFDSSSPLVMLHGGLHKLQSGSNNYSSSSLFVVVNPKCRTWSRVACISPRRFAHGLVEVGYGTYLVVGGVYNGDSESVEHGGPEERKGLAKLEVLWHEERGWVGEESAIKIVMSSGRQKGNQEPQQFPCYDCRCHFQALMVPTAPVHSRKLSLLLLGGGASAGFGMHFCQDVRIMVGSIQDELMRSIPIPFQELVPSCPGTVGHIPQTSDNLSSMMALVVCSTSAHRVKMHLESNGWLNKTKRVGNYAFAKAGAEDQHINIQIDKALLECLQIESNQPAVDVDCPGELRDFGKSAEMLKAIPVTPAFLHAFVSCEESLSSSAVSGLYRAMFSHRKPTDATMTLHLTPQKNSHGSRPSHSALLALQRQGRLKVTHAILRQIVHLCCGATDFGNDAIENNEKAGTKFEIVGGSGGAVMVPEGLVQALVDEAIHGGAPAHAGEIEEAALEQLWRDFLANFAGRDTHPMRKPTRVAYKQRIALGPRRESQIRLLYPLPKGDPEELELMFSPLPPLAHLPRFLRGWRPKKTGPGAPGWTHLIENEIGQRICN